MSKVTSECGSRRRDGVTCNLLAGHDGEHGWIRLDGGRPSEFWPRGDWKCARCHSALVTTEGAWCVPCVVPLTAPPTAAEAERLRLDLRTAEAALKSLAPVLECALDLIEREQDRGSCFLCDTKLASCKCSDMYAFRKAVWPHHPFRPSVDGSRCTYVKPEGDGPCDSPEAWHPCRRRPTSAPTKGEP